MAASTDHQLGVDLRRSRPPGSLNAQVLEGMLRDLVGADLSLLPPLLEVVQQPELLDLDPDAASPRQRAQLRDRILAGLSGIYHPGVLDRLRSFLDGYLNLEVIAWRQEPSAAAGRAQRSQPSQHRPTAAAASGVPAWSTPAASAPPSPAAPRPKPAAPGANAAAAAAAGRHSSAAGLPQDSAAAGSPEGSPAASPASDRTDSSPPQRVAAAGARADQVVVAGPGAGRRAAPLVLGMVLVAAAAIAVGARMPPFCTRLGWCAAAASTAASEPSLAAAGRAATALSTATDLASFQRNLAELDHQLGRLPAARLTTQQRQRRDSLRITAREGRQRLERERQQARLVSQAEQRGRALAALPAERQAAERTALVAELTTIPAGSFAHAAAQQQLQALRGPAAAAGATPPVPPPPTSTPASPGPVTPDRGSAEPRRSGSRPPRSPGAAGQAAPSPARAEPAPTPEPEGLGRDKPAASREESGGRKPARSIDQNEGNNTPPG